MPHLPLGFLGVGLGNPLQPALHHVVPLPSLTDVQDACTCGSSLRTMVRMNHNNDLRLEI